MAASGKTTQPVEESASSKAPRALVVHWVAPRAIGAVQLCRSRIVLGRAPDCDVVLEGEGVSRRHCEIYRQGPIFAVRDLGSTNGTFLNGRRSSHGVVAPDSVIRLGDCVGVFLERGVGEADPSGAELAPGLIGGCELERVLEPARRAANSDLPIVILGETGTGKEGAARAIHHWSGRRGPFHAINCAALPEGLAEAELFGYRKGAFTGADRSGTGHFRAAHEGTLFLDELAELSLPVQAKLLRALQEGRVTALGETTATPVDVRVLVATRRPLEELVEALEFRDDLRARLAGLTVRLPLLRERRADIPLLFEHFIRRYSGGRPPVIDPRLIERLCLYTWPANVRELELLARQLIAVYSLEPVLRCSFLPEPISSGSVGAGDDEAGHFRPQQERREYDLGRLVDALRRSGGNVKEAARLIGLSRQRAYRLMNGTPAETLLAGPGPGRVPPNGSS